MDETFTFEKTKARQVFFVKFYFKINKNRLCSMTCGIDKILG